MIEPHHDFMLGVVTATGQNINVHSPNLIARCKVNVCAMLYHDFIFTWISHAPIFTNKSHAPLNLL